MKTSKKGERCVPIGISIPVDIVERLDKQRGDVTRSRYLLRIIESWMEDNGRLPRAA